jgi:sugar phosphate isomerase/epimerase
MSFSKKKAPKYRIAACDWMILKRQKIGSFKLVSELKGDGVEVDMGGLGTRDSFDNKLRQASFRKLFKEEAAKYKLEIPSIAMSGFYAQSFVKRENYKDLVQDCIQTMVGMGVKIAFLPLGVGCDLTKNPELRPVLVKRLKIIGKMASKAGVIIGIETSLDAEGDVKLLSEINSSSIKIYYNFQNPLVAGRDLYKELRILGKKRICQIHCTDTDDVLLPYNKRLDMNKVKNALDEIGWSGWLVVERSRDKNDPRNVMKNFGTNIDYLKQIFQNETFGY